MIKKYLSRGVCLLLVTFLTACNLTFTTDNTTRTQLGTSTYALVRWNTPRNTLDVVFFADAFYGDVAGNLTARQAFLDDVADIIDTGFWQSNGIVNNIALFNFWYSTMTGARVDPPLPGAVCPRATLPAAGRAEVAFAEMVIVLHRSGVRDCSGTPTTLDAGVSEAWVGPHEAGHQLFGIPDEYVGGGYWSAPPVLYSDSAECNSDPVNASWRDCRPFFSAGQMWWRSEGNTEDVMSVGGPPTIQWGRADWVLVRRVLDRLRGAGYVANPDVYAPDSWSWR